MAYESPTDLLVLHAIRLKGMADVGSVVERFSLDRALVEELLLDYEARRWIERVGFADLSGWTLTGTGRVENSRRLAAELAETGAREPIADSHSIFLQLNGLFLTAVTKWQIRPTPWDPLAANDHDDWRWDERVIKELASLRRRLQPVCERLSGTLTRFDGYPDRFSAALDRVDQGQTAWVDQPGIDSCHLIWFELHEDLLATLGLERGQES